MTIAQVDRDAEDEHGSPGGPSVDSARARLRRIDPADSEDERLALALEAVAAGDRDAFALVYDTAASRVLGLCRKVLVDPHLAEEVAQEVFLEVWQTADRFDRERGRALTWLLTMAHRRAIDRVRASQSSRDRDLRVGIRDFDEYEPGVEDGVEISMEFDRASAAMDQLTDVQREALDLAYFRGLTQTEIATRLGIPLGTVKTRLRDALIRLRSLLGDTR